MVIFKQIRLMVKPHPTKRALDGWDSAPFSSFIYAQAESCSQVLSTPAHPQVTQAVRCLCPQFVVGISVVNIVFLNILKTVILQSVDVAEMFSFLCWVAGVTFTHLTKFCTQTRLCRRPPSLVLAWRVSSLLSLILSRAGKNNRWA